MLTVSVPPAPPCHPALLHHTPMFTIFARFLQILPVCVCLSTLMLYIRGAVVQEEASPLTIMASLQRRPLLTQRLALL